MILIIGGAYQGKRNYVLSQFSCTESDIAQIPEKMTDFPQQRVIDEYHNWVKQMLREGVDPIRYTAELLQQNQNRIIICNELGSGIVPIEASDRQWREVTGRLCCRLAEEAEEVHRICCGLPTILKGKN